MSSECLCILCDGKHFLYECSFYNDIPDKSISVLQKNATANLLHCHVSR